MRSCLSVALCVMTLGVPAAVGAQADDPSNELVAVGIVKRGAAVLLATPGLEEHRRYWRFRSFDTIELAGPLRQAVLADHATKLFLQSPQAGLVVDLTRQRRHNAPLQHIDPRVPALGGATAAGPSHRLPDQRFVEIRNGKAHVIDDMGVEQPEYPVMEAVDAAISGDGVVFYLRPDRTSTICGETDGDWHRCRDCLNASMPAQRCPSSRVRRLSPPAPVDFGCWSAPRLRHESSIRTSRVNRDPCGAPRRPCVLP